MKGSKKLTTSKLGIIQYKAFTLVELSVVITILAVMIIGVTSTKLMIRKARLTNAQSLTQKSIINDINMDLVAWYETSLESSFLASEIKNDASNISTWKDNNINAINKNDATNSTVASQPKYYQNAFYDSIPGIRFDGTDDFLNFNCNKIAKSSYTIFVVEQRRSNKSVNMFIGGSSIANNETIHLGYKYNTTLTQDHYSNGLDATVTGYNSVEPKLFTFVYNFNIGKQITINGKTTVVANPTQSSPLLKCNNVALGKYATSYFYTGDLAEIIMFKRSLKTEEIEAIENYLGSKYGISVS